MASLYIVAYKAPDSFWVVWRETSGYKIRLYPNHNGGDPEDKDPGEWGEPLRALEEIGSTPSKESLIELIQGDDYSPGRPIDLGTKTVLDCLKFAMQILNRVQVRVSAPLRVLV